MVLTCLKGPWEDFKHVNFLPLLAVFVCSKCGFPICGCHDLCISKATATLAMPYWRLGWYSP